MSDAERRWCEYDPLFSWVESVVEFTIPHPEALQSAISDQDIDRIAALARQRDMQRSGQKIEQSSLWNTFGLFDDEHFERIARKDIMNELISAGCIAKDGSDIYVRPALVSLSEPEDHLPVLEVSDK